MDIGEDLDRSLKETKERIINYLILIGGLLGLATWLISGMQNIYIRWFELLSIILVLTVYIFRDIYSLRVKLLIVICIAYSLVLTDIYNYGPNGSNTVLLIIGGYSALLVFNRTQTLIIYFIGVALFLGFGICSIALVEGYPHSNVYQWMVEALMISIVGIPIIFYNSTYIKTIEDLIAYLKCRNVTLKENELELNQYKNNLERQVKSRTKALTHANEALKEQTYYLQQSIKDLKQTQQQLIHSEKMASLGVLIAGVGHEINNPLNYIQGGYEGLSRLIQEFPIESNDKKSEAQQHLNTVQDGISRVAGIVRSLKHASRQSETMIERCDIHQILDHCILMIHNQTKHKAKIRKAFNADYPILQGNDGKLHQAFLNILSNAEQAIQSEGKITIETSITDDNLIVTVIDNGIGMTEEQLSKIGDPFFTTKDPGKGTGLGLYITFDIVRQHSGTWTIHSSPSEGTVFTLSFPLVNQTSLHREFLMDN